MKQDVLDVIVVGGGHAGCEAALAAARSGARTMLVTMDRRAIARMSCNPSIGGIAKGHIVHEIDALGGEMAINTDYTGIQFRTLNTSRGPAVQSSRAQADKQAYSERMAAVVESQSGLSVVDGEVVELLSEDSVVSGVMLKDGSTLRAKAVAVTAGTFINGTIHVGDKCRAGGRDGEPAAVSLGGSLIRLGIRMTRLKTGTPPRLMRESMDFSRMERQPGDYPPPFFSDVARSEWRRMFHVEHPSPDGVARRAGGGEAGEATFHVEHERRLRPWPLDASQLDCYLTHTTGKTHDIVRRNLARSSLYGGFIKGTGVRYCPSLEDKVVKFPDRDQHHVFVEPEGRSTRLIYPNGLSNSLPADVQVEVIRSIPGLERAEFASLAYAIEYDFADPTQLDSTLESKVVRGLFLAGQVNGTTGYEEAAGQGFIAGVNAARKALGLSPVVISRFDAYIGVMIDDLVTKGVDEPYRMFTSRAEHRLLIRQDNSRFRLRDYAETIGIVPAGVISRTDAVLRAVTDEIDRLSRTSVGPSTLLQILRRPEVSYSTLDGRRDDLDEEVKRQVEISVKYDGYIRRELDLAARMRRMDEQAIPQWLDYSKITSLRVESRQKLQSVKPATLGQASRIPGVNPVDVSLLAVVMRRGAESA